MGYAINIDCFSAHIARTKMKRPSRKRLLVKTAAHIATGLIRTVKATSRTVHEPPDLIERLRAQVPFIMAMWHGQFMMLADLNTREFNVSAMVARHGMLRLWHTFSLSLEFLPFAAPAPAEESETVAASTRSERLIMLWIVERSWR